jgi:hypothetical protein
LDCVLHDQMLGLKSGQFIEPRWDSNDEYVVQITV